MRSFKNMLRLSRRKPEYYVPYEYRAQRSVVLYQYMSMCSHREQAL